MEYILLKELQYDPAEEIVELITMSYMNVTCKIEKGVAEGTVDMIIKINPDDVKFNIMSEHNTLYFEFIDENEVLSFEVSYNMLTDLIIR